MYREMNREKLTSNIQAKQQANTTKHDSYRSYEAIVEDMESFDFGKALEM